MNSGKLFAIKEVRHDLYRQYQAQLAEFLERKRLELSQQTKYVDLRTDFQDDQRVSLSDVLAFVREQGLDPSRVTLMSGEDIELVHSVPLTEAEVLRGVEDAKRYWTCPEVEELAQRIRDLDAQIVREVLG